MNIHNAPMRPKPHLHVLTWILLSLAVFTGVGTTLFFFAWEQSEKERIAPWKEGWNYEGASQALKMYPNEPAAHIAMASVWVKQKQYDNAIQEYQKAIKLEPTNAYTHLDLGNALASSGQPLKAQLQWQTAKRLDIPGGNAAKEASDNLIKNAMPLK